ncbi:uncharacterized protein [Cardiocondyla obscurior]|uniref:uncharacterized protein n=1 Tax=Cardiocondyla obscurior TaxID=286306 RepID=UPI0039655E4F
MTLKELRAEASRHGLPDRGEQSTRASIVQEILTHLERTREDTGESEGPPEEPVAGPSTRPSAQVGERFVTEQRLQELLQANAFVQQQLIIQQQEQMFARLTEILAIRQATAPAPTSSAAPDEREEPVNLRPQGGSSPARSSGGSQQSGLPIKWIATQIPEFGGTENENVQQWVDRVDTAARIHGASDAATVVAASSRLTGAARKWYDLKTGPVMESWVALKKELLAMFRRHVPFYDRIKKVEARKWLAGKETFDNYVVEKQVLMQPLEMSAEDQIQMLIGGIQTSSLRVTAMSLRAKTVEKFVEEMRYLAAAHTDSERHPVARPPPALRNERPCRNCGGRGHFHKECKADVTCFFCKAKGHRQYDCPVLKNRGNRTERAAPRTAANIDEDGAAGGPSGETVATVRETDRRVEVDEPYLDVRGLQGEDCKFRALIDTGSPVSFIKNTVYKNYIEPKRLLLKPAIGKFKNLSNERLKIEGIVRVRINFLQLPTENLEIDLHVLSHDLCESDVILGRQFISGAKLTLIYKPSSLAENERVQLFTNLPLCIDADTNEEDVIIKVIEESNLNAPSRIELKKVLERVNHAKVTPITDDYAVRVKLRDESTYAYAPRRFAFAERCEIREIVDELLDRGIIKKSTSPYCARVVPVKRKSGAMRLCVDLRPLNARVEKQNFPFPIIEECLSRLAGKRVFTLLDLKDGFH